MEDNRLPGYIEYLLRRDAYPHPAAEIELIQTHISFVIVAGDYVYKWKKPVDFGFVDFSTLEKRNYFCEQELCLNRRLCADIYLEMVWVSSEGQSYRLNGTGDVIEYGVKMVRMPADRMMDRVIAAGGLNRGHLTGIVNILVPFYQHTNRGGPLREKGEVAAVKKNIDDNFAQTERFVGCEVLGAERFERIRSYTDAMLQHTEFFKQRIAADGIRDCHGDLYSGNICLDENIHIFDCIEFNEDLRCIDIASDVAFLAMDLDYHGHSGLSDFFIKSFVAGIGDEGIYTVLNFYKCYRAYVRGKVGLLTAFDASMEKDVADRWYRAAGRYLQLAEDYATRQGRPGGNK